MVSIYTAVWHKISGYVLLFDRLKNSGCWYFNKMMNNSVHQEHLSIFSLSVEILPAKISCSIHYLFVRNRLSDFTSMSGSFYPSKFAASLSKK